MPAILSSVTLNGPSKVTFPVLVITYRYSTTSSTAAYGSPDSTCLSKARAGFLQYSTTVFSPFVSHPSTYSFPERASTGVPLAMAVTLAWFSIKSASSMSDCSNSYVAVKVALPPTKSTVAELPAEADTKPIAGNGVLFPVNEAATSVRLTPVKPIFPVLVTTNVYSISSPAAGQSDSPSATINSPVLRSDIAQLFTVTTTSSTTSHPPTETPFI